MPAGPADYDGVPYTNLTFDEIDWSETEEHIRNRVNRTGLPTEFNVAPEWATKALMDPGRLVGSAESRSGLTVKVVGFSPNAPGTQGGFGRLLTVLVAPKDHPPVGRWWGATAMATNADDRRRYKENQT